jgi:hypothetical protein
MAFRVRIPADTDDLLVAKFFNLLPFTSEFHYTKISGEGLYLFVPFFIPPDRMTPVGTLSRGTLAYWPNRQLLLIYYGKFEKEDASVMVLGEIDEGLEEISILGEQVKKYQRQPVQLIL